MEKIWRWTASDTAVVHEIIKSTGVSPVIAQLLAIRGIHDPQRIRAFLEPKLTDLREPTLLPGLSNAVERLYSAIRNNKKIVIYGDYDADGMTATSILINCLKQLDADVTYFVPNRLEDGYGLNCDSLRVLHQRGREVVVTVDCGICSLEEADLCRELGIELIITDHHQMLDMLPNAHAIVHPSLPGHDYPFAGLCGAGVAYKLAWGLCQKVSNSNRVLPALREFLLEALSLAAIGTIADVVPLIDENRSLVRHGLNTLRSKPTIGMLKLLEVTNLLRKSTLASEDIAFTLAPRLNAAGRLGQAQLAVELMTTDNSTRAEALASYLHKLNADRETLERSMVIAANKQIKEQFDEANDPAFVLAAPNWHPGVIGVVSGRLSEKYHRPVVIIALDPLGQKPGSGSCRSPGYVNLHDGLMSCKEHLISCGGHAAAAGLRIQEQHVPAFRAAFCEYVAAKTSGKKIAPEIQIDAQVQIQSVDLDTVQKIDMLAPFGAHNPRPILGATNVEFAEEPRAIGNNERHFGARFKQNNATMRAVAFGQAEWVGQMKELSGPFDVVFRPVINEFNGFKRVEMHVVDWRVNQAAKVAAGVA
jgi:single-stranded-DNA-specific exonuclease